MPGLSIKNDWEKHEAESVQEKCVLLLHQIPNPRPSDPKPKKVKHLLLEKFNEEG